jgi:hypothetical protein
MQRTEMKKSRLKEFTSSIFQQRSLQWFAALSSRLSLSFGYWFDASGNVRLRFDSITEFTSSSILG